MKYRNRDGFYQPHLAEIKPTINNAALLTMTGNRWPQLTPHNEASTDKNWKSQLDYEIPGYAHQHLSVLDLLADKPAELAEQLNALTKESLAIDPLLSPAPRSEYLALKKAKF